MSEMDTGERYGAVTVDELHEMDYGADGVMRVGLAWTPAAPAERERTRDALLAVAAQAIRRRIEIADGASAGQ